MIFFGNLPKSLLFIWFSQIAIVSVLWNFLPTQNSALLLIGLIIVNAILLYSRQLDLPLLTSVILILSLSHFWQGNGFINPLVGSTLIFVGVALTGMATQILKGSFNQDSGLAWILIGLFTSQIATLTQYWPVSFFQKALQLHQHFPSLQDQILLYDDFLKSACSKIF